MWSLLAGDPHPGFACKQAPTSIAKKIRSSNGEPRPEFKGSATRARLTFRSPVFQHRFAFDLAGIPHRSSDNYFELYPGEKKTVEVELTRPQTAAQLRRALVFRSLVDTF